jgi:membrane fusion protein
MTLALFRQEAVDHQRHRLLGDVLVYQPIAQRSLAWLAVAIAAAIGSFLFWGEYARKEGVHGLLVPDRGVVQVYARNAGTIVELSVTENQIITEGQPLLTVQVEQSTQNGGLADTVTLEVIARRKIEAEAQIKLAEQNAEFDRRNLVTQIAAIAEEVEQLHKQREIQTQLAALAEADVKAAESLKRSGAVTETEFRRRSEAFLTAAQREADLGRQLVSRNGDLAQTRNKLEQLPVTTADRISQLRAAVLDLDQRAAEIEGKRAYVARAPIAGRVTALQAAVGTNADGRLPLLTIVPVDGKLQAEIYIPSRAIGFVKPDQEVRLLYEAFPYQRFGAYRGRVLTVSKAILAASEVPAVIGAKEPVYRAVVELASQTIAAEGQTIPLQAGEQLTANIILDRRTLFEWILSPLAEVKLLS